MRNRGLRGYRPRQAQELAHSRRHTAHHTRISTARRARAEDLLRQDWSPEQVSGWLLREEGITISHEWVYQYVYADKRDGGDLHKHLGCQTPPRKRCGSDDRRGQIKDRVCIDEPPGVVEQRSRIGNREADTVIGKPGGAVSVTLAERKTRQSILALSPDKSEKAVKKSIVGTLQPHAAHVHTITYDNGKEFAHHTQIKDALDASGYFAHPYHSWEHGLNETINGLIRQYLRKCKSFDLLTRDDIQRIMDKLNNRARKCLGFKTPNQVFFGINPPVALAS